VLLGAIAEGTSRIENFLPAADCLATVQAVRALGICVDELAPAKLVVHGKGMHGLSEPEDIIDCVRSGTTMRLLAGILAGQGFTSILSGREQLRRRPMGRIADPLRAMGATILGRDGGRRPPLTIRGGNLRGIDYTLPVASAQVKSAIMLAGLYAKGKTIIHEPGPARDHTERMLQARGGPMEIDGPRMELRPGRPLRAIDTTVPGDFSSAAFLLVAATLVPDSKLTIEDVGINSTRTGLLEVLQAMGADIVLGPERLIGGEPVANLTVRSSALNGKEIGGDQVVRMIDEFPILAVAATQAQGETVVRDATELRVKETDRIATTVRELQKLGAQIEPRPDGMIVHGPTQLTGQQVTSHGDHRLAMALSIAGLVAKGQTEVQDTACIGDSFPGFTNTVEHLQSGTQQP
jgi:3-phosphoshikimate 1-carboxyvinyltransferase